MVNKQSVPDDVSYWRDNRSLHHSLSPCVCIISPYHGWNTQFLYYGWETIPTMGGRFSFLLWVAYLMMFPTGVIIEARITVRLPAFAQSFSTVHGWENHFLYDLSLPWVEI